MSEIDLIGLTIVTGVVAIGSASQAAIGMGLNLFAIPLLLLVNPIYAPGPVLVASFVLSILALWRVPAKVDGGELKIAVFGLLVGTALAAVITALVDTSSLTRLLGLFVVVGVGLALSGWSASLSKQNLLLSGGGAGLLGTIAGVHAPPIALLYQGLAPDRVRGAILTFVGIGNGLSIIALVIVGRFGTDQMVATLLLLPGMILGLWFAPLLARSIDAQSLKIAVLVVSGITGTLLLAG